MRAHLGRFAYAFLFTVWASSALATDSLRGAVKVGKNELSSHEISAALQECEEHAPASKRTDCIRAYFVPRWLMDAYSADGRMAESPKWRHRENDLLFRSMHERIQTQIGQPSANEIEGYLNANSRDFRKPTRLRIFRILLNTEEEAKKLLRDLGTNVSIEAFRKAARQSSVDTATNERGGDLGFVWPDGTTDVPQVKADPALYSAAKQLADGEIAPLPVKEGKRAAVVWRRGSLPALELNEDSRKIAALRVREAKTESALKALLDDLSKKYLRSRQNILLGKLRRKNAQLFK